MILDSASAVVLLTLCLLAPSLAAQDRPPAEAEKIYHDVGEQLNCVCGACRDKLLECSHNRCEAKEVQRAYLRELSQDSKLDAPGIRQAMATRFGERVLQVPPDSHLYVVLGLALLALAGAFGGMFWYVAGKRRAAAGMTPPTPDKSSARGETELRIERDMQELP